MARAELLGDLRVVLAARVGVADQQRDRRAGGAAFVDAAEGSRPRRPRAAARYGACGRWRGAPGRGGSRPARSRGRAGSRRSTQPIAGPWLSPKVVTANSLPKVLLDTSLIAPRRRRADQPALRSRRDERLDRRCATRSSRSTTKMPICPTLNSTQANGSSGSSSTSARSASPTSQISRPCSLRCSRRVAQDLQREVQAVVAGAQAEFGLVRVLLRQRVGLVVGDVRRIGDDQVVDLALQAVEQVRRSRRDVVGVQARLVLLRQRQRLVADVDAVDLPVRVVVRHGDGDAARAGAQVERALDLAAAQPGLEAATRSVRRSASAAPARARSHLKLSPANQASPVR